MYVAQALNPNLQKHAEALGYVCINWSWLEFIAELLFSDLAGLPSDKQETHCIVVEITFSKKLTMMQSLGYLKRPSDQWYADWEKLIKKIDTELRVKRNRFVHDLWQTDEGVKHPTRTQPMAKLAKPQSHRPRQLMTHKTIEVDVEEIKKLSEEINLAAKQLHKMMFDGGLLLPRKH